MFCPVRHKPGSVFLAGGDGVWGLPQQALGVACLVGEDATGGPAEGGACIAPSPYASNKRAGKPPPVAPSALL